VDLTRNHPRPCLQFYIKRCLGPCVKELTTPEIYGEAVRDVRLFLEGRQTDLLKSLRERMSETAEAQEFERAARYRDLISTVEHYRRSSVSPPPKATTPTFSASTMKIKCWP